MNGSDIRTVQELLGTQILEPLRFILMSLVINEQVHLARLTPF